MRGRSLVAWNRARTAWSVLLGNPCPRCPADHGKLPAPAAGFSAAGPMAIGVGLVVESSRTRPDTDALNALLADIAHADLPNVIAALAILGAVLGQELALHDATGPAEILRHIGLVAARDEAA